MGYIRNAVLIEAPVEEVFRLTNDVRTWPTLFTEYESSKVLEEAQDSVTFRLTTRPDEEGHQWSWIAKRQTNVSRRSTYSERMPSSGPFERMVIRWWYDRVSDTNTVMTWEQEFTMKPQAPINEERVTDYLNKQTRIQQQVIKEKIEQICRSSHKQETLYRGLIVLRHQVGSASKITDAFKRSDETELPHIIGVKSRHIWVLGDIYLHFVEAQIPLATILKDYAQHPLYKAVKAEVDQHVTSISPELPRLATEIYSWQNPNVLSSKVVGKVFTHKERQKDMSTIMQNSKLCTLINTFTVTPERQQELVDVLIEAANQVIRTLPGFVSANIHKSLDGVRVTNYAQWESEAALQAMLSNPEASKHINKCREITQHVDFHLYTVEFCGASQN